MKKYTPKHAKEKNGNLYKVLFVLFILIFVFSSYKYFSIVQRNKKADNVYSELRSQVQYYPASADTAAPAASGIQNETAESNPGATAAKRKRTIDFTALCERYPNMRGWIVAEDLEIDYPVMQAEDNDFYMDRLYDATYNPCGAIFIDYRNSGIFTDDNTVIYGHNIKNGAMFHGLNEYKSQSYYDAHPTITVYTPEGDCLIELICGTVEDGNYDFVKFRFENFDQMKSYVSLYKSYSTFQSSVELQLGDKLVSLCTCTYEQDNARYMLLGRVKELYE